MRTQTCIPRHFANDLGAKNKRKFWDVYVLDLFSGIGGFSLGLERAGFQTAAFCEINPFCRAVLRKHWPSVPCFEDVRTLDRAALEARGIHSVDVICGGYPCQPFSAAGKRRGTADDRHLWPEMFRLICELRPTWVIGENVGGHITMGLDDVLSDLENAGYTARAFVIPACAVNAPHRRGRVWIVAHANRAREQQSERADEKKRERLGNCCSNVANPEISVSGRLPERTAEAKPGLAFAGPHRATLLPAREPRHWYAEPSVGRVANGIPCRMDRNQSLGNAVVPEQPEIIGRAILGGLFE